MEARASWLVMRQYSASSPSVHQENCNRHLNRILNSCSAEDLLHQIDQVIQRVAKNQLSAGQGWREVKRIMNNVESKTQDGSLYEV